tara:strand:+ start:242 stop:457 length:216 start_codon:yes stop_codon:yes gene_type:complete
MKNKLGTYIVNLMSVIKDTEQDGFVKELAFDELKKLNVNIEEFLRKNTKDDSEEREQTEKQLLQEEKNGKD